MTRAEAIKQVLENLRVIDAITQPAAEDIAIVGRRLDQERSRLKERELVWWESDAIPDSVSGAFCDLVAESCQNAFGKTYSAGNAESRIAAVKSSTKREAQQAEYF